MCFFFVFFNMLCILLLSFLPLVKVVTELKKSFSSLNLVLLAPQNTLLYLGKETFFPFFHSEQHFSTLKF